MMLTSNQQTNLLGYVVYNFKKISMVRMKLKSSIYSLENFGISD